MPLNHLSWLTDENRLATMLRSPQMHPKKDSIPLWKVERQVFWLIPIATPSRSSGPVAKACCNLIRGLTAAGTAADFHGIPFSSRGVLPDPL